MNHQDEIECCGHADVYARALLPCGLGINKCFEPRFVFYPKSILY